MDQPTLFADPIGVVNAEVSPVFASPKFGTLNGQGTGGSNSGWTVAGLGDFDGDRDTDILWRNGSAIVLWRLNGQGQLVGGGYRPALAPSFSLRGVGDLNGDGVQDVVWRDDLRSVVDHRTANVTLLWSFDRSGNATQTTLLAAASSIGLS